MEQAFCIEVYIECPFHRGGKIQCWIYTNALLNKEQDYSLVASLVQKPLLTC